MTIAICCPTNEGVVLGADSATTVQPAVPQGFEIAIRHFNHAQKLFEVGQNHDFGSLMIATWGLGSIDDLSHRTLVAELADMLDKPDHAGKSVEEVANLWNDHIWEKFSVGLQGPIARAKALSLKELSAFEELELQTLKAKAARDSKEGARLQDLESRKRTEGEEIEFKSLANLHGGYYLAGRRRNERATYAY